MEKSEDLVMSQEKRSQDEGPEREAASGRVATVIHEALRGLQFGQVTIIVQDGVVIQIERTEKKRLTRKPRSSG
jgi:hypothetical protein